MAVKTITIDMEAYSLLAAEKRNKESFSRVIKRRLRPSNTAENLLRHLGDIALSNDALDHTEELIKTRREKSSLPPVFDED